MKRYEYMKRDYLSEKQIALYDEMLELVEQHKEINVYTQVSAEEAEETVIALIRDYPEYCIAWKYEGATPDVKNNKGYWVKGTYLYEKSKTRVLHHSIDKYIKENIHPYVKRARCKTEKDIVTAVYKYLAGVLTYTEKKEKKNGELVFPHKAHTIETLYDLEGVCQGIALSLIYVLREYEIECLYIRGYTDDDKPDANNGAPTHGWCLVKLDGIYYHMDLTWDLQQQDFQYFLLTDDEIYQRHHRWDKSKYPKAG